jgi:hypothetical protein
MVMLLWFVIEFEQKCQGTDAVEIDNIEIQYGPLN